MFITLALLFNLTIPIFEAPDEQVHYLYVHHLATGRGLPIQVERELASYAGQQSSQPPLYYALVAAVTAPIDASDVRSDIQDIFAAPRRPATTGPEQQVTTSAALFSHDADELFPYRGTALAVHAGRLVSTLLGLATVLCTYAAVRSIAEPLLALLAASLVALNPQLIFLSAVINNDNAVIAFAAAALWIGVLIVRGDDDSRLWWIFGLVAALASASKYHGLALYLMAAIVFGLRPPRRWLSSVIALGAPLVVLVGWWYARNVLLYGDPLGWRAFVASAGRLIYTGERGLTFWIDRLELLWQSSWLTFGWMNVRAPDWFYWAVALLPVAAAVGWLRIAANVECRRWVVARWRPLTLALAWAVVQSALMLVWIASGPSGAQGRLLFPAIAAFAILGAVGLAGVGNRAVATALGCALIAADVWAWWAVLRPAYA